MFERPLYKSKKCWKQYVKGESMESVKASAIVSVIQKENSALLHLMLYELYKTNKEQWVLNDNH